MNRKIIGILAMLSILTLVIAQVPVHAQTGSPAEGKGNLIRGLVGEAFASAPDGHAQALLPALGDLYNIALEFEAPAVPEVPEWKDYVPEEWQWLVDLGLENFDMEFQPMTGLVRNSSWPGPWPPPPPPTAPGPVIPGTWAPLVSLATNAGPANFFPEFNPAIAANPTVPANQIEGQFDVDTTQLGTGQAMRCSIRVSPFAAALPTFLPVDGVAAAAGGLSFCTRALPAFSDDGGIAYVLWTDYEVMPGFAGSYTAFKMIRSVNNGATWTNLAGVALPVGPAAAGFGTVRQFQTLGPATGELPITPSLAVSGNGPTTRIHIAYATFTNLLTNDIRSISSNNGGATFTNPVVIQSINPFLGPLRLLLAPSNSYLMRDVVHVVWYDDVAVPPLFFQGVFRTGIVRSNDNGVTYTAPATLAIRPETLPFDIFTSPFLFVWPTHFPHIVSDAATNRVYVIFGESWSWILWPLNPMDLFLVYSADGGTTWNFQYPFPEWHIADSSQFYPAITVQHTDGTVHVTYASREDVFGNFPILGFPYPWFNMVYTSSDPAHLRPTLTVEQWVEGQRVSGYVWDTWYLGTFFSVAASTANVYSAFVAGRGPGWPSLFNDNTWLGTGTKQPAAPVGGTALSADMLTLLMPYMLIAVLATIGLAYALRRRFRSIALPQIPSIRS